MDSSGACKSRQKGAVALDEATKDGAILTRMPSSIRSFSPFSIRFAVHPQDIGDEFACRLTSSPSSAMPSFISGVV